MSYIGKRYHRHYKRTPGRLPPWAIVGICLGAAILLTVIVGNLLNLWLDDDTYDKLVGKTEELTDEPYSEPVRTVPKTHAYPFALGDSIGSLTPGGALPPPALSVPVNTPDGLPLYTSDVTKLQGFANTPAILLKKSMGTLIKTVPYLSGVFYPQALSQPTDDLFYASTLAEIALLREFVNCGASELILLDLPLDPEQIPRTLSYIRQVKEALNGIPVGVALPLSAVESPEGWELLPSLNEVSSFLLLDLREESQDNPEETFSHVPYFTVQCQMRLLLSADQTAFINLADSAMDDVQVVKSFQKEPSDGKQDG